MYYWISATKEGRKILLGPYKTEDEATEKGMEKLDISFDVIPLPTSDESRATRMLKAKILEDTSDIDVSLKRVSHKMNNKEEVMD